MRTHLISLLLGAVLGAVLASILVPPAITWYATPGGMPKGTPMQVLVDPKILIHYATSRLLIGQAVGAVIGAAVCLFLSIFIAGKVRRPATP